MIRKILTSCVAVLVLGGMFAAGAFADTLILQDKSSLEGKVKQITYMADGKVVVVEREAVVSAFLAASGDDLLDLSDGRQVRGEIMNVVFTAASGDTTYARSQLSSIGVTDSAAEVRKELKKKKLNLDSKDPAATVELAEWCKAKALRDEARTLAEASLQLKPDKKIAARAHEVLDEVLVNGKWVARGGLATTGAQTTEPASAAAGSTDADKEAIKAAATLNTTLKGQYLKKASDAKDEQFKAIKTANEKEWNKAQDDYEKAKDDVERLGIAVRQAEATARDTRKSADYWHLRQVQTNLDNAQQKQKAAVAKIDQIKATVLAGQTKAQQCYDKRTERVTLVFNRHSRILLNGTIPPEADMRAAYDKAYDTE